MFILCSVKHCLYSSIHSFQIILFILKNANQGNRECRHEMLTRSHGLFHEIYVQITKIMKTATQSRDVIIKMCRIDFAIKLWHQFCPEHFYRKNELPV